MTTWFPTSGRQEMTQLLPAAGCSLTGVPGIAARPLRFDLPRRSVRPNSSFIRWAAAAPAMMIIEPMATHCSVIARRSLAMLFAIIWAWGAKIATIIGRRQRHQPEAFRSGG
ncbi:MAG TPA: hypothetical protein VKU02_19825 [Gemmataceae bacterium]|nr:hypothetical protein [Gemmataceae bacterium]